MIGVIAKPEQAGVVEEFFELFKTPWEWYGSGRAYDVVITTTTDSPESGVKLLLIYSAATHPLDHELGAIEGVRYDQGILADQGRPVPVYGQLLRFAQRSNGCVCVATETETVGLRYAGAGSTVMRLGYDLFDEVQFLLTIGQPAKYAHIPTLEMHIRTLRRWIVEAGVQVLEIPPTPANYDFITCLTHDIDFVGIRRHCLDHTMWGFLYRATLGAMGKFLRGSLPLSGLVKCWLAAASLPLVYAGWMTDFWEPFEWYLRVEHGLPTTYFLIPFKRRNGDKVPGRRASRRATAYDVSDIPAWTELLQERGCELGVHGIDAWHSADLGRDELSVLRAATGGRSEGIRMHWLLRDANTPLVLEQAGYSYDATCGYNETVGYRAGTGQVFRPLGATALLQLPLQIQDGALFYPGRLALAEADADKRCRDLTSDAVEFGGALTLLWHDRSHAAERFWGDFYVRLLNTLRSLNGWFGTAGQVVGWFRHRREIRFEQLPGSSELGAAILYDGEAIQPPLRVRIYRPQPCNEEGSSAKNASAEVIDIPWNGRSAAELERQLCSRLASSSSAPFCTHS